MGNQSIHMIKVIVTVFLMLSSHHIVVVATGREQQLRTLNDSARRTIPQKVYFTFQVETGLDRNVSSLPVRDTYISDCLVRSFNDIHNPTRHRVVKIEVKKQVVKVVVPSNPNSSWNISRMSSSWDPLRFNIWSILWTYNCRGCPAPQSTKASTSTNSSNWERGFCACLRVSSDEVLSTAQKCHIRYSKPLGKGK